MNPTHATPTGPITVDPDAAFLGCLMRCDAPAALQLLAGMEPTDVAQPLAEEVLALAIHLVARDIAPDPAVLLAEARHQGRLDTEHKHELLTDWLIDTYRTAPDPAVGEYLKAAVLEAAYRRALREHAQRLLARVETVDATELTELADLDDHAVDLWHRHQEAIADDTTRPITPAVPFPPATSQLSAITERLSRAEPPSPSATEDSSDRAAQDDSEHDTGDHKQRGEAA